MELPKIRTSFLKFFENNNHIILPSSSLVPNNDPTLMFTNAGMVQFKNLFTGEEKSEVSRAATSQKCVRAGGKHNDLDNVGYTARHHTFFEMLGNFSFGDYFKEQAIEFAWQCLTKEFGLPKDKLYITVYHTDDEAYNIWKKLTGFSDNKIIKITTNDNFWSMGEVGPCGPCSEIFYDHGEKVAGGLPGTPEADGDRYIEIWNLVFMQYEQLANGSKIDLPKPSIDTGMGLERISAVLQGVHDNYEIDLFQNIIKATEELIKVKAKGDNYPSFKVIADHLRSSCFLLADGVMPSNEGRGYVLRRIMRRSMRHVYQLGCNEPLMYRLVPTLIEQMGEAFPELKRASNFIAEILKLEEEKFKETLGRGLKLLANETANLNKGDTLKGETAFMLYDTYGFPLDLTKDILRSKQINIDDKQFDACMQEQKSRARAAWSGSGEQVVNEIWFDIVNKFGASEFLGYKQIEAQGEVLALVKDDKLINMVDETIEGKFFIITNQTPFYGESGGQMGDIGYITNNQGLSIEIIDTKKYLGSLHAHVAIIKKGTIKIGDFVKLQIDIDYRNKLRANHSVTHLLHAVLRRVLGNHVMQKGSLVAADKLRFDFSHLKALSLEEKLVIEQEVNKLIFANSKVGTRIMEVDKAIECGAMALFGEKYDAEVRVVSMGNDSVDYYSTELCGGTHVSRTGDIGIFKIISESAISSGVRRIEAVTQYEAIKYIQNQEIILQELSSLLKSKSEEIIDRVTIIINDKKKLDRQIAELKKSSFSLNVEGEIQVINHIKLLIKILDDFPAKELRNAAEQLVKQIDHGIVTLFSIIEGRVSMVVAVTPSLTDKFDATFLVRSLSGVLGGSGGGGKPSLAQGGGTDPNKINNSIDLLKSMLNH